MNNRFQVSPFSLPHISGHHLCALLACLCLFFSVSSTAYAVASALKTLDLRTTENRQAKLTLQLDKPAARVQSYQIENPARIIIDLYNTENHLSQKSFQYNQSQVQSITGVQAGNRTRLVVKLDQPSSFQTVSNGSEVSVTIGQLAPATVAGRKPALSSPANPSGRQLPRIRDIDFRRGADNESLFILELERADIDFQLSETDSKNLRLDLKQANLPKALRRQLDVADFATPMQSISARQQSDNVRFDFRLAGDFSYMAYQTGRTLTVEAKPLTPAEKEAQLKKRFPYTGQKLSLNFQNIDIRQVLQIIAEATDLNLVTSDSVQGSVTLRLEQVPWDQALELVMESKGLASRKSGNVLMVAPADELAERERKELVSRQENRDLANLTSEFIQIKYAKSSDIALILNGSDGNPGLLSKRGRALVDERTNTILLQDVPSSIEAIKEVVRKLDIPVQQVLIEARIVIARSNLSSDLGVRWTGGSDAGISSGTANIGESGLAVDLASGGSYTSINPGTGSFALGYADSSILVDMELAALASEGKGEIISQPKVITANKRKALIKSGKQIPYREESSSGGTKIAFKDAVLALEVTPQITPDEHIIMDLKITQDALGNQEYDGAPAIDTNAIETQVLVNDGETIVLGGIYTSESFDQNFKVPLLGDIPLLGALFRRSEKSQEKVELLVFITPRLIEDSVSLN